MKRRCTIVLTLLCLALFSAGQAQATNLVANWTFNEGNGATSFNDSSGNGHTGTLQGTDVLTSIPGQIGTGLMFNGVAGTGNYISVPDAHDYFSGENKLTVSSWVYWPASTGTSVQVSQLFSAWDYNGGSQAYKFGFYATTGRMSFNLTNATTLYPSFWRNVSGNGPDYTRGQWNLLTVEYDGMDSNTSTDRMEIYVNGVTVQAGSFRAPSGFGPYHLPQAAVGQVLEIAGGENGWTGGLNDMGIWNTVLTGGANAIGANNRGTTGGEVLAMYKTPTSGYAALSQYGVKPMDQLFTLYDSQSAGTTDITSNGATITWHYVASGLGVGSGYAGQVDGNYVVQLDDAGGGVVGVPVPAPEPSTLVLLAAGLVGLLAYTWRKRK